jgi:hypothetical protein
MDEISFRGGSRVGWTNATFPLVKLTCSRDRLALSGFGSHEFTPQQVVGFGTYGSIPFFGNGLSIEHNRLDYPARMVFWCMGSRQRVLDEIRRVGFVPSGVAVERPRGMPLRLGFAIGCVLVWNIGFWSDTRLQFHPGTPTLPFGPGVVATLAALFVVATGIKVSPRLQRIVLAPGHVVGEVRGLLTLLQLISGAMAGAFGLALFLAGRP